MEKKYELSNTTLKIDGRVLHRIKALRTFGNVKEGELGGFIENEHNLSHEDNAWVYDVAAVYDEAQVFGDAEVHNCAQVFDKAAVFQKARIYGGALVYGNAGVYGNAMISSIARIFDKAQISGNARIKGGAWIYGKARVYGAASIYDDVHVCGDVRVHGETEICDNAKLTKDEDYIVFKNWWSSGRSFTWTRSNNMWRVGCFYGTDEELVKKAYKDSEVSGREYLRIVNYVREIQGKSPYYPLIINKKLDETQH